MSVPTPRPISGAARALAAVGGFVVLVLASLFTFGLALCVAVAIGVAALVARHRGRALTRRASWIVAVSTAGGLLLVLGASAATMIPEGAVAKILQSADSASANAPVPAWVERLAPGTTAAKSRREARTGVETAVDVWAMVVGSAMAWVIASCLVGSIGWVATLPIAFAVTGRWLTPPKSFLPAVDRG